MTEKEMIDEMASDIRVALEIGTYENLPIYIKDRVLTGVRFNETAKILANKYQPKIPEGSVVLSKEEYELYDVVKKGYPNDMTCLAEKLTQIDHKARYETLEKIKLKPIECGEECGYYYLDISVTGKELLQRVYFNSDFIDRKARKETAKEFAE